MIRVAFARFGLKFKSSILTLRGGTDANAPERLRTAILRDWHVGVLGPHFLEKYWNIVKQIVQQKYEHAFLRDQDLTKLATHAFIWIRKCARTPWRP